MALSQLCTVSSCKNITHSQADFPGPSPSDSKVGEFGKESGLESEGLQGNLQQKAAHKALEWLHFHAGCKAFPYFLVMLSDALNSEMKGTKLGQIVISCFLVYI